VVLTVGWFALFLWLQLALDSKARVFSDTQIDNHTTYRVHSSRVQKRFISSCTLLSAYYMTYRFIELFYHSRNSRKNIYLQCRGLIRTRRESLVVEHTLLISVSLAFGILGCATPSRLGTLDRGRLCLRTLRLVAWLKCSVCVGRSLGQLNGHIDVHVSQDILLFVITTTEKESVSKAQNIKCGDRDETC
jgi:hypothetical protein